jgi:hypothetical protein
VIRSYWKGNQRGRGRYVRASTRDLDDDEEASEEIIQSRVMDIGERGKKTQSIAMRRLESTYNQSHGYDNPFIDDVWPSADTKVSSHHGPPNTGSVETLPRNDYLPI